MSLILIKITDKNDAAGAAQARGELEGAGFSIAYEGDADGVGVDAQRAGGGNDAYDAAWVLVGKK
jgi:hypothetical protein